MKAASHTFRQRPLLIVWVLLGILILIVIGLILFSQTRDAFEDEGSVSVVMCPQCEEVFLNLLRGGGDIECALYDFGPATETALRAAKARVVTDDEDGGNYGQKIKQTGLMHDKFCVINNSIVTSGSYNPTENGELNRNNLVVIQSKTLAQNYHQEFLAIAAGRNHKPITHVVIVNGTRIENYFCPQDSCEKHVQTALASASNEILFFQFVLTSDSLTRTISQQRDASVKVEGVCDGSQWNVQGGDCAQLGAYRWDLPYLLHHKVFVIDRETIVTGSYNPTNSGDRRNRENVLIITNPYLAAQYLTEYETLRNEATNNTITRPQATLTGSEP